MSRNFTTNADHLDNTVPAVSAVPMTLSAWVKLAALGVAQDTVTIGQAAVNANRWTVAAASTNVPQAVVRDAAAQSAASSTLTYSSGVWVLITAVFSDDTNRAAFGNGANKGTNAVLRFPAVPPTNTRVSANPAGNNPVNGLIAHVAIWNIALSDSDVLALYTNLPSAVQPSNLQEYWPLTGGASPEPSIGILGNSLTVTGTTFNSDDPYGQPVILMGQAIF